MSHGRIARLLAQAHTVAPLKPWPRYEVGHVAFDEIGHALGEGERELFGLWAEPGRVHMALRAIGEAPSVVSTVLIDGGFPSIGRWHAPAIRLERTIHDLYGYRPVGAADKRPWLDHGAWEIENPLGTRAACALRDPADYAFLPVHGRGCIRFRSDRCTPASSSPPISASPPTAKSWRGWRNGSAMCTRGSMR